MHPTSKRARIVSRRPTSSYCITCRTRRVKCDEGRPFCRRCILAGKTCEGYKSWIITLTPQVCFDGTTKAMEGWSDRDSHGSAGSDSKALETSCGAVSPFRSPFGHTAAFASDASQFAFAEFINKAIPKMLQQSPHEGQTRRSIQIALSMSRQDPSVYFTLAAMGSSLRGMPNTMHTSLLRPANNQRSIVTLELYCKAIGYRTANLSDAPNDLTIEPLLMTAFLFMVLEVFRGDARSAEQHYRFTKKILEAFRSAGGSPSPEALHLGRFFELAGHDLRTHDARALCVSPESDVSHPSCYVKAEVAPGLCQAISSSTLAEMSARADRLTDEASQTLADLYQLGQEQASAASVRDMQISSPMQYCLAHSLSRVIDLVHHTDLEARLRTLQRAHVRFGAELAGWEASVSGDERSKYLLLRIRFLSSYLAVLACRDSSETLTDSVG